MSGAYVDVYNGLRFFKRLNNCLAPVRIKYFRLIVDIIERIWLIFFKIK
jgi:hypothetical protein